MGRVKIVTDSTCDIPPEWIRELDITVLPCDIIFGQEFFQEGVDLTTQEFYSRLNEG
ncbi:MAG: DegV family protein, partial [Anaerolineae bacterium]